MGVVSNRINRENLKAGDHIYSWRKPYIYAHHGIYVGDGKVIHFTPGTGQVVGTGTSFDRFATSSFPSPSLNSPCPRCGSYQATPLLGVLTSCIDCFLMGGDPYLFEYSVSTAYFLAQPRGGTCTMAKSDPESDVLHRASCLLQNGFCDYNIFRGHCEDFAIYCKTGLLIINNIGVGTSGHTTAAMAATSTLISWRLRLGLATVGTLGTLAGVVANCCISRYKSDIGVRRDTIKVPVEMFITMETVFAGSQNQESEEEQRNEENREEIEDEDNNNSDNLELEKAKEQRDEDKEKEIKDDDKNNIDNQELEKEEKEKEMRDEEKKKEIKDCLLYLWTGTCELGLNCKFNHPARNKNQAFNMAVEANAKGYAAFSAGQSHEAIRFFSEAIDQFPRNHILHSNRSAAYASIHKYTEALSDAKKTVEINPDWPKGYNRLGVAHGGLGSIDEAVAAYMKGLQLDPNNEALKSGLAYAATRSRDPPIGNVFQDAKKAT